MDQYYYFNVNIFTGTGFTTTDETRDWLLKPDVVIPRLAKYLFYEDKDFRPPLLQTISVVVEPTMNREECIPDRVLADYLGFGLYYFVS